MGEDNMPIKSVLEKNQWEETLTLTIDEDTGWVGPKPAATREEKINQIKTEFITGMNMLIEGASADDFKEYPQIPAEISVADLIQYVSDFKKEKGRSFVVVQGLDTLPVSEQSKFVTLLKDKRIWDRSMPDNVQFLLPVQNGKSVSREIWNLSLFIKV